MSEFLQYNELRLQVSSNREEFLDFIFLLGIDAVEEDGECLVIRSEEDLELVKWGIEEFAKKLNETSAKKVEFKLSISTKSNQDWVEVYKKSIQPIQINNFYIRPSWCENKKGLDNIVIDPSLTFGSGHHESTNACIKMLSIYAKKGDELLDVGCGSGILSIVGAKIGAKVSCCDTDELAIEQAQKNAKLNAVSYERSWVGSIQKNAKQYDLITANIIADILILLSSDLQKALKPNGILILSGILDKYEKKVLNFFKDCTICQIEAMNEWRTIVLKR